MSNQITKTSMPPVDGIDGYEDRIEGENGSQSVIQGQVVKFTNSGTWEIQGEKPPEELVFVSVRRVVQKWVDQKPVETRTLARGEAWPDVEALNEAAPTSEWRDGPGGCVGPWQCQRIVYLLDPVTLDKLTFPTGTTGGRLAIEELVDKVRWMRRMRGASVHPVIKLAAKAMKTRYGTRPRPHFMIVRWTSLGESGEQLPAPTALLAVQPPSVSEDLDDQIPENLLAAG